MSAAPDDNDNEPSGTAPPSRIRSLVDVRRHERGLLTAAISFAFLSVASAIVARAVGDALFLTAYPLASIPRFFIVSNIALIGGAMLYSSLVRVVRPVTLNVTGVAILAASMIAGRAVLPAEEASWGLYGLCVWLAVAPPLLNILCWNAIVDRLDSRQSRFVCEEYRAGKNGEQDDSGSTG